LGVGALQIYKKSRLSWNSGVIAPLGAHPQNVAFAYDVFENQRRGFNFKIISAFVAVRLKFISARGNLPEIISKLFHKLRFIVFAAHEYFPTCSCSVAEIISK